MYSTESRSTLASSLRSSTYSSSSSISTTGGFYSSSSDEEEDAVKGALQLLFIEHLIEKKQEKYPLEDDQFYLIGFVNVFDETFQEFKEYLLAQIEYGLRKQKPKCKFSESQYRFILVGREDMEFVEYSKMGKAFFKNLLNFDKFGSLVVIPNDYNLKELAKTTFFIGWFKEYCLMA